MTADVDCVIPTHDRPHYLIQALGSVAAQTVRPREVVVVSDVADAASGMVVDQFSSDHPDLECRYVERTESRPGASASRNAGAAVTRSAHIAFLDDDDLWEPTYLETALAALQDQQVDAVATALRRFGVGAGGEVMVPAVGLSARDVFRTSPGVTGSSLVVDRAAFERVGGFDPELPVQNDRDFFLRFLLAGGRYAVVGEPLVRLRRHAGGRLTDPSQMRADGILLFLGKHSESFPARDRRVLRYLSHRTRLSAASSAGVLARSGIGALLNWSPTAGRQIPLALFRTSRLRRLRHRQLSGAGQV